MSTQQDINANRAQRLANIHDPLTLMANTQTPFHPYHSSFITYIQHTQHNNNFVPQPSFNTNYLQHPMQNPKDILNPTTTLDMALKLMAKNTVQNQGIQNVGNQNGLNVVPRIANQHGNVNVIAARAKDTTTDCPKKEAWIQLNSEEFDFMAAVDGSAEVHHSENCYDNDIFEMFTQEEHYTELLRPIPESHQVQQNDSNVISTVSSVEQGGRTIEQHSATVDEMLAYHESLFHNLAVEVEKVNSVNRKIKETNAHLTT
nr:hypothetical protein [Tanacetum cinerariifolium]GEZ56232.1 hypothetical protein [Tanacetum cinerariifolium]